jgi:hypothetical protein
MNTALGWLTAFHTLISLVATIVGLWAIRDVMAGRVRSGAITTFLWTAVITSVTGFFFPFHGVTPAIIVGIIALIVLAWTVASRRSIGRSGFWTAQFPVGIVISEYFLAFVLVAQIFAKWPALAAIPADTRQKLFGATELVVLIIFIVIAVRAIKTFRVRAVA